jgi:hypothetical protein
LATQFTKLAREGTRPDRLRGALLYSTAMRTALALTLALVALPLSAETLVVDGQVQVRPVSIELPRRGSSMAQVEARFGAPRTRHAAVGQPPITRWDYDGFSVYFEHQHVIHAVAHGG